MLARWKKRATAKQHKKETANQKTYQSRTFANHTEAGADLVRTRRGPRPPKTHVNPFKKIKIYLYFALIISIGPQQLRFKTSIPSPTLEKKNLGFTERLLNTYSGKRLLVSLTLQSLRPRKLPRILARKSHGTRVLPGKWWKWLIIDKWWKWLLSDKRLPGWRHLQTINFDDRECYTIR